MATEDYVWPVTDTWPDWSGWSVKASAPVVTAEDRTTVVEDEDRTTVVRSD